MDNEYLLIAKNKHSGKYFIILDQPGDVSSLFITPEGEVKYLTNKLFNQEIEVTQIEAIDCYSINTMQLSKLLDYPLDNLIKTDNDPESWGEISPWGHRTDSISGQIDKLLYFNKKGITLEEISASCSCNISRVKDHINHLRKGTRSEGRRAIISESVNSDNKTTFKLHDGFQN